MQTRLVYGNGDASPRGSEARGIQIPILNPIPAQCNCPRFGLMRINGADTFAIYLVDSRSSSGLNGTTMFERKNQASIIYSGGSAVCWLKENETKSRTS